MKRQTEVITIHKVNNCLGKDELYADWYECPKCSDIYNTRRNNFCGNCGVQFEWTEGGEK